MALATLSIDIEARLAKLEAGMQQAVRLNERTATLIEQRWSKLDNLGGSFIKGINRAFAGLSLGAVAVTFGALVARTAEGIDALNDLSDATGASVENLSALEDTAMRAGTSFDTVGAALVKLNAALNEADGKNAASQAIAAIGLSVDQLKQLDPAEALRRVAVALSSYADDGNKARLVQELFGRSIREVAPLLKDLASQGELVATVTREQAEQAERFSKGLAALRKDVTDYARALTGEAIPAVQAFLDRFNKIGGLSGIADRLNTERLEQAATAEARTLNEQIKRNERLIEQSGGAADPRNAKAVKMLELMRARLDELIDRAQQYRSKLDAIGDRVFGVKADLASSIADLEAAAQGRPSLTFAPATPDRTTRVDRRPVVIQGPAFPQDLADALKRIEQSDPVRLRELNDELERLVQIQSYDANRTGLAAAIARTRDEIDKLDPTVQTMQRAFKEVESILGATISGQAADLQRQLQLVDDAFAAGAISAGEYGAAIDSLYRKLDQLNQRGDPIKGIEQLDARWQQFGANVQDVLADAFENGFEDANRAFERAIKRMLAQAAAAQLGNALFGDYFRTGQVGGLFGSIAAAAGSSSAGGFVPLNGPAGGITNGYAGKQSAGITYAPTIVVQGGTNRSEVYAAAAEASRRSQQQFIDSIQRGIITLP